MLFLIVLTFICNDERQRFLVPEVNSGADDLASILKDFIVLDY